MHFVWRRLVNAYENLVGKPLRENEKVSLRQILVNGIVSMGGG
jgi:hypothetical protein